MMNVDELLRQDAVPADESILLAALAAFGFVSVVSSCGLGASGLWICTITGTRRVTAHAWIGIGSSADDARQAAVAEISKWILNTIPTP